MRRRIKTRLRKNVYASLPKVADGMITVYHGTTVKELKNITNDGKFIANKSDNGARINIKDEQDKQDTIGFTYFANSWHLAEVYAELASDNSFDANDVDTQAGAILTLELPTSMLLADTWNSHDSQDWQDSWDSTGQVKVAGDVDISYITEVEILDPVDFESVLQTNFSSWLQKYEEIKPTLKSQEEDM